VLDTLSLLWPLRPASAAAAEHLREDITMAAASSASALLESLLSLSVIDLSLVLVAKHLVCVRNFLELLRITSFVGMFLQSFLVISFLDLSELRIFVNSEELIELLVVHGFLRSTATGRAAMHARKLFEREATKHYFELIIIKRY